MEIYPTSKENLLRKVEALIARDYTNISEIVRKDSNRFADKTSAQRPIFAKNVNIGKNIYGTTLSADYLLYSPHLDPTKRAIRCFWQEQSGSAERKRPFDVLSIRKSDYQTIIIIEGGGFSNGAEKWLRDQQGSGNLLKVLGYQQFRRFYMSKLAPGLF